MNKIYTLLAILIITTISCHQPSKKATEKTVDEKIDSILSLMTLEEKIGQLNLLSSDWDNTGPTMRKDYEDLIRKGQLGNIFNAFTTKYIRKLQKIAVEETRLKIPLLFGYDVIHGHKTIFPTPLAESCSWDLEAIEKSARISAIEAAASGLNWTFAPMVDIARDPRWGRIMEGAGEDTYLGTQIAKARVKGFQTDDLSDPLSILACAKHYAAYGAAQGGRDYNTVDMSEITLRNVYLPPFKAAVDAGVATIMTSFNELNGIPATANKLLLKQILRKEWNFKGFVVTDYTSINEMVLHGYAKNEKHAAQLALNAGVDMDMQGSEYLRYINELLTENKISQQEIDDAVRFILRKKFELGLFNDPYLYCSEEREKNRTYAPENIEAARDMAKKSIILLKNNEHILPLNKQTKKIALIGPLGNTKHEILGSWRAAGDDNKSISLLDALNERKDIDVTFVKACDIHSKDKSGFKSAIQAAQKADIVLLALGESADMSGEAASRSNINLPGVQTDLLKELKATGKKIVLILMNGRPLVITEENELADAILETWFAGTQAGNAICDVLFGDYNPSGKLSVTFPRNIGQIPIYYNMKNTGRPISESKYTSKYLDISNQPLFPFGFGLSYTTFKFSDFQLSDTILHDSIIASIKIKNTGKVKGEEVVQLYTQQHVGSLTRPVRELKAFKKLMLNANETKTITFVLKPKDLAYYNANSEYTTEEGKYTIYIGNSSNAQLNKSFTYKLR